MKIQELKDWIINDGKLETQLGPKYIQCDEDIDVHRSLLGYIFGDNSALIYFNLLNMKPEKPFIKVDKDKLYLFPGKPGESYIEMDFAYPFLLRYSWKENLYRFRLFFLDLNMDRT